MYLTADNPQLNVLTSMYIARVHRVINVSPKVYTRNNTRIYTEYLITQMQSYRCQMSMLNTSAFGWYTKFSTCNGIQETGTHQSRRL